MEEIKKFKCLFFCVGIFIVIPHLIIFYGFPLLDQSPVTTAGRRGLGFLYCLLSFTTVIFAQRYCIGSNLEVTLLIVFMSAIAIKFIPVPDQSLKIYGEHILTFLPITTVVGGLVWGYLQ